MGVEALLDQACNKLEDRERVKLAAELLNNSDVTTELAQYFFKELDDSTHDELTIQAVAEDER